MKKSKFDIVYESIKEDLKKRLFMEDAETEQEDPALEDDIATEETTNDVATEETTNDEVEEDSKDPELVKEFLDNMQINAQDAASGNDVKVTAV